jgi:superfamily II DNA or RNA helicase
MDTILPESFALDRQDRFARLPTVERRLLGLVSLIFFPAAKSEFHDCVSKARLRDAHGKALTQRATNALLEALVRKGFLADGRACEPAVAHLAAVDAMGSESGEAMVAAVRAVFLETRPMYFYSYDPAKDVERVLRAIRLAVYANDAAVFTANRLRLEAEQTAGRTAGFLAAVFGGVALEMDWLATRHPILQSALLEAKFLAAVRTGGPDPELPALIALYRERWGQEGFGDFRHLLMRLDLLGLRLAEIREQLAGFSQPPDVTRMALEASIAFVEGDNAIALARFREALKTHRKNLGRRKVFLEGEFGLLFIMALLRANDPKVHAEIQAGLDAVLSDEQPSVHRPGYWAMQALLWLVQGVEAKARSVLGQFHELPLQQPLPAACIALAEFAVDRHLSRDTAERLADHFAATRQAMPLIARINAEILAEVADRPAPYKAWLAETGGDRWVAFTGLVQSRQPWERALESLELFLDGGAKADAGKAPAQTKRLAWFVDPDMLDVGAVEQSVKGGGWTDGRPVAMKRLREQDPRLDYLTPQDRAALRHIRKEGTTWHGEDTYAFDAPRAIVALAGHPVVFDARHRSRQLELVAYPLELVVTEQKGGYRVALSHSAEEPTVFLEPETPTRYRIIEFPQRLLAVQEILGRNGLTVPKSGRDQVVAMARRNNPALPVRAEIAEVERPGIAAQAAPVVQLVPYEQGLKLALLVRPFGAEGPAYVAGLGGRSVLATVSGQQVRATRDLPRELAERAALIEACPTLRDRCGADTHELVLEDIEGCLDLLLELRARTPPVSIEWPEGQTMRVSAVTPANMKLRVGQDRDWFSVDGTVALDDDQVLEMRFLLERLERAQGRFVVLGDGRFVALTRQLQTQLQRLAAVSEPHRNGRRVHALGAPALDAVLEDAGEIKVDAAWKRHVARIRAAGDWTPALPETLQADLRDYQVEGFVWLSRLARWGAGACLADDMGLGKTVQAIAVMLDRAEQGPCLVVAPTSVCPNWVAEIARFAPTLTTHRLAAAAERAAQIEALGARDVLVCSYGLLHQAGETLAGREWQMVVLDEAQAIKNAETQRARATQTLRAGFRLALTGTPVENYLDELWSLFSFVNPGVLGSREGFQKRFARPIERDKDPNARQALRALIRPFLLRRTKAAVLSELPPRTEQTMHVEMTEPERAFYEALRQRSLERIAASDAPEGKRKIQILAEITRLRRACCNPGLIDAAAGVPSGKLTAFLELVEELIRNRHRALVFSQFVGHLELVRAALDARGIRYEYLDGGTPSAERERRVAAFQAGEAALFLISLRAGGTGLNLTAADYVVHLDPWWNPAVEDQASDRAHRIGQKRPVTIYRLIMEDSIEERILALHRDKRDLATELLDGTETAARLSEEALLDLIRGDSVP